MTNKKPVTKLTLLGAVVALLLCVAMLMGTTYAWFTDSVTSSGNIIKTGKLNIDLLVKGGDLDTTGLTADADGYYSVKAASNKIWNNVKWEPGYTSWVNAKVTTTGNLALKYTMKITADGAVGTLANVIDVYYSPTEVAKPTNRDLTGLTKLGTLAEAIAGTLVINDTLIPEPKTGETENKTDFATLALHMQEDAGNEYQELTVGTTGFSLQILATQYTYEEDSFDDQYDVGAVYPVTNAAEFAEALENAQDGDIIDAGGNTIGALVGDNVDSAVTIANAVFQRTTAPDPIYGGNTSSDIEGTTFEKAVEFVGCTFDATDAVYCNNFKGGATFTNCTFNGGWSSIYNNTSNGDVTIKDCTIVAYAYAINFGGGDGDNTLKIINCNIKGWNSFGDTAFSKVEITNCTFDKSSGYGVLRFYQDATVTNCTFTDAFEFVDSNKTGITVEFTNCTGITTAKIFNNVEDGVEHVSNWWIDGTNVSENVGPHD